MGDYHVHLHPHAVEPAPPPGDFSFGLIEAYVEAAADRGVAEVGFTEHLYRFTEAATPLGRFWERESRTDLGEQSQRFVAVERILSLEAYCAAVVEARERGLPVLLGLEVDFFPDSIDDVLEVLAPYRWDYLIGSVHWIGGWALDHPEVQAEFERRGVDKAYEQYFELVTQLAASGVVDVLGHVDVVKKFGHRASRERLDLYEEVARAAAASGTAVEVSSAGLRRPVNEIYPSPSFLRVLREAGVPITIASDAHRPANTGIGLSEAIDAARTAGYQERLAFRAREARSLPL